MAVTPLVPQYPKTPWHTKTAWLLSVIELKLWAIKVYIAGIAISDNYCCCDLDPMTFIYELDLYSLDSHEMCK